MTDTGTTPGKPNQSGTCDQESDRFFTALTTADAVEARNRLESLHPDMLARYPLQAYINLLDDTQRDTSTLAVSARVKAFWEDVIETWGAEGLEVYNRLAMLQLMSAFEERARPYDYPQSTLENIKTSFQRIENNILFGETGKYLHTDDSFIKDFALCRQTAFPGGGAWIVDLHGGYSLKTLFAGGIGQFFSLAFFYLFVCKGNRRCYSPHVHNDLVKYFSSEERQACHARIAEMLERHPEVVGLVGISWLLDPVVPIISPKLAWQRQVPLENGAKYFRYRKDTSGAALVRSPTRQKLYEEGKYVPTDYLTIWHRDKIIAWAKKRALQQKGTNVQTNKAP
jgi:hypothetical protein